MSAVQVRAVRVRRSTRLRHLDSNTKWAAHRPRAGLGHDIVLQPGKETVALNIYAWCNDIVVLVYPLGYTVQECDCS